MNYKPGTKIRFDGRFNKLTVCGQARHQNARRTRKQPLPVWFNVLVIITILTGLWGAIEDQNRPQRLTVLPAVETVKASEVLPLNGSTEFTSADMPVDLFEKYFGDKSNIIRAICKAENTAQNSNAINRNKNGSIDQGLCQINTINVEYYVGENIFDNDVNVKTAKKIYDSQGFTAWTVYKTGAYKKYLDN